MEIFADHVEYLISVRCGPPNHRARGCNHRDTIGDFRLEITPQLRLRDQMYRDQQTTKWKDRYKIRSGIEATISELKRSHGFRKLRVRRAAKVCFAVACKVIACNIKRWAKAYTGSKSPLERSILSSLCLLKVFLTDLIKEPLMWRKICSQKC